MENIWTFRKVRLKNMEADFPCEWMLVIRTVKELWQYYSETRPTVIQTALQDWIKTTSQPIQKDHFRNHISQTVYFLSALNDCSFIESITKLFGQVEQNQISQLSKGKTLYIRSIGSYTFGDQYETLDEFQSSELLFPLDKVRFLQWSGGKHWYAKIGNTDIVVEGEQKWNSKVEAQKAASKFILENWTTLKTGILPQ